MRSLKRVVANALVSFAYSADRTSVEFAAPLSVIGSPTRVETLWDANDTTFLPTDYSLAVYGIATA